MGHSGGPFTLVLAAPLPRQTVLRIMSIGFALMVLLVVAAAFVGYRGSRSIDDNAQDLVRENLIDTSRGAALEARIEKKSAELLGWLTWILGSCLVLAIVGSVLTIWITNRAFRRLEWQSRELNQVSWHLVNSHERIARRFSHEMHDEMGQALAGLKGVVKRMSPGDIEPARAEMIAILDEVLGGVRELSQMLRPVILDDFGLDAGLRWLTDRFTQRTRTPVEYTSTFTSRLADPLETHLFRIAQEALTNIARHSGASLAWVRLDVSASTVCLTVEDDGCGIADTSVRRPSLGMVGMRARARQLGGELLVENREVGGLRIRVEAPLESPHDVTQPEDADFTR